MNRKYLRFVVALGVLAVTWLAVLPAIGRHPHVRTTIDRQEDRGVDPSAMFYTELDAFRDWRERLRLRRSARTRMIGQASSGSSSPIDDFTQDSSSSSSSSSSP